MTCFLPAPYYYRFVMHNLHFVSTPIYIFTLVSLFREQSKVFQTYKYFIIAHIITNLLSEAYVTFFWLPQSHLPYDVFKTTGWLAEWGFSGVFQFMILNQFMTFVGLSIQEMFVHRFKVVVIHQSNSIYMKMPRYSINAYRFLCMVHILSITWITSNDHIMKLQQNKKDELFRKIPNLPKDIGCYTVFILAPEDPFLVGNVILWGVLLSFGTIATFSSVFFINRFLKTSKNLSIATRKLQKMLMTSLYWQTSIHAVLIIFPVCVQIYQIISTFNNNDFATMLLFSTDSFPLAPWCIPLSSYGRKWGFSPVFVAVRRKDPEVKCNFLSEAYVTFLWLPMTHLPYDVYKTSGWLAEWGVSGVVQFMTLAQFLNVTCVSILEMFHYRFRVVVIHQPKMKLPTYSMIAFRFVSAAHLLTMIYLTVNAQTKIHQQNKKDELFKKFPGLPPDIGCYTVFILAPQDPVLVFIVALWGVLTVIGTVVIVSTVGGIDRFLRVARNLSKETKRLQKMLVWSLLAQSTIHGTFIVFPISVQIWQMLVGLNNDDFASILLFLVAYHGFFSTCAMIVFTKQIRLKFVQFFRCFNQKEKKQTFGSRKINIEATNVETKTF